MSAGLSRGQEEASVATKKQARGRGGGHMIRKLRGSLVGHGEGFALECNRNLLEE